MTTNNFNTAAMNNNNSIFNDDPFELFNNYIVENAWIEVPEENIEFTQEMLDTIIRAEVVSGNYGLSVKIRRVKNGKIIITFVPLSINSKLRLGDIIDCSKCRFICLKKKGEDPIYRFEEI